MTDRIDNTGRIVIPKRIRMECGLVAGSKSKLEFTPVPESQSVIVKKGALDFCLRCGTTENLTQLNEDAYLCRRCLQSLLPKE